MPDYFEIHKKDKIVREIEKILRSYLTSGNYLNTYYCSYLLLVITTEHKYISRCLYLNKYKTVFDDKFYQKVRDFLHYRRKFI
ncbi:MAG: hypothetical protein IJ890_05515 [Clostridia bacterium]|nr:hypothetical protein [Clostridia bacterium]